MTPYTRRIISTIILAAFISTSVKSPAYAQLADQMPRLPVPGVMVHLSPEFTPAHLQGITIHPDNALRFDFLIHRGDQELDGNQKKEEYKRLVKYFLASLTIPDEDQWVNLSPYEKDRIIKDDFGKTEMGRDLLAEDYMLKQITSSLIYPEDGLGKKFWDRIYERAWKEYHTTDIPVNTFNKVWIVPDQAYVYESGNSAYILQSHLKVMLEEDYLSLKKHSGTTSSPASSVRTNSIGSQVIREIILPELEREVNEDKNFSDLRQMYSGMILATWYKESLKESLLGRIYADKAKVKGVDQDPPTNEEIYKRYLKAFKRGVFNYIREDVDKYTNEEIPRKYFSGGWKGFDKAEIVARNTDFGRTGVLFIVDRATISFIPKTSMAALVPEDSLDRATVVFNPKGEHKVERNALGGDAAMTTKKRIVVFAEDDSNILKLAEEMIKEQGFDVLTAASPDELKKIMSEHGEEVSVLITDTTGWIVAVKDALSKVEDKFKRRIPVIATSGRDSRKDWEMADVPINVFLSKPYGLEQLENAVDGVLPNDAAMTGAEKVAEKLVTIGKASGNVVSVQLLRVDASSVEVNIINSQGVLLDSRIGKIINKGDVEYLQSVVNDDLIYIENLEVLRAELYEGLDITFGRPLVSIPGSGLVMQRHVQAGDRMFTIRLRKDESNSVRIYLDIFTEGPGPVLIDSLGGMLTNPMNGLKYWSRKIEKFGFQFDNLNDLWAKLYGDDPQIKWDRPDAAMTSMGPVMNVKGSEHERAVSGLIQQAENYIEDAPFAEDLSKGEAELKRTRVILDQLQGGIPAAGTLRDKFTRVNENYWKGWLDIAQQFMNRGLIEQESAILDDLDKNSPKLSLPLRARLSSMQRFYEKIKTEFEEERSRQRQKGIMEKAVAKIGEQGPRELLGVSSDASPEQTKAAYWRLVRQLHPDAPGNVNRPPKERKGLEDRLKAITVAYADLTKDAAMMGKTDRYGGIDFNSANLNLFIKRDGKGVPLPLAQQDMAQLNEVQGFVPQIIEIRPAVNVPIISELQQKLQTSSV